MLEQAIFQFLDRKYVQRQDARQRKIGLQYMTAETHDLASEIARFIEQNNLIVSSESTTKPPTPEQLDFDRKEVRYIADFFIVDSSS